MKKKPFQSLSTISFLLFLLSVTCYSQRVGLITSPPGSLGQNFILEIIEVKSENRFSHKETPFDRPFFAKLTTPTIMGVKATSIYSVNIIFPDGSFMPVSNRIEVQDTNSYIEVFPLIPGNNYILEVAWVAGGFTEKYYLTTKIDSLKKRLKSRIVPQLGVSSSFFKSINGFSFKPSLVLGVYVHPFPIDPNLEMSNYKPFAPRRFSLFYGLTLNSMSESTIRENLFGSNNFIAGIGYQPFDAIRITYGRILFYELNPDRVISNEKKIATTSNLTLTIDLELKEILGGIITTLGFK